MGLLIDSTVLIEAERVQRSPQGLVQDLIERFGDIDLALSVMSAAELLHGCWRADTAARRAQRTEFVESVLATVPVLPITMPVARVLGEIDAGLRARGVRIPTSDLLIACTALAHGHGVATGNARHFKQVPGLSVRVLTAEPPPPRRRRRRG